MCRERPAFLCGVEVVNHAAPAFGFPSLPLCSVSRHNSNSLTEDWKLQAGDGECLLYTSALTHTGWDAPCSSLTEMGGGTKRSNRRCSSSDCIRAMRSEPHGENTFSFSAMSLNCKHLGDGPAIKNVTLCKHPLPPCWKVGGKTHAFFILIL